MVLKAENAPEILLPPPLTVTVTCSPSSCLGSNTGSVTILAVVGGNGTYTYLWSNGATNVTGIFNLAPGTYTCTVSDTGTPRETAVVTKTVLYTPDNVPPTLNIPADRTVLCSAPRSPLSLFGNATFSDNCIGAKLKIDSVFTLNGCNIGTIRRIFTVTDSIGNKTTKTQVITLTNPNASVTAVQNIVFPPNYFTNSCTPRSKLNPDSLPAPFNRPVVTLVANSCNNVYVGYDDLVFNGQNIPACYKIVRIWKVIDWCIYKPNTSSNAGYTEFAQSLVVMDTTPPVLNIPANVSVSVGANCAATSVTLPPATATDCSPNIVIQNNQNTNGANASGNFPLGVTTVIFTAKDSCGNSTTKSMTVTIIDNKKPTAVCQALLNMPLGVMNGQGMSVVQTNQVNNNSFDNCTSKSLLKYKLKKLGSSAVAADSLALNCVDFNVNSNHSVTIQLFVTDEAGNTESCLSSVRLSDNQNICSPSNSTAQIAGAIHDEIGNNVEDVTVNISNGSSSTVTGAAGFFNFLQIPFGTSGLTLEPTKDMNITNGVTTYDMVQIRKHILGVKPLESPYKIIAADINKSGSITTYDLVALRKVILGIDQNFENNRSWRFIRADYVFPNPTNPFEEIFPEKYDIPLIESDMNGVNFMAIKVGDVDGSAAANHFSDANVESRSEQPFFFEMNDAYLYAGQEYEASVKSNGFNNVTSWQFTFVFDPKKLAVEDVAQGLLPNLTTDNFGLSHLSDGYLTAAWDYDAPLTLPNKDPLFKVKFRAKANGYLSQMLKMNSEITRSVVFSTDEKGGNVTAQVGALTFRKDGNLNPAEEGFSLYQNKPNPWQNGTLIGFQLPKADAIQLKIMDIAGREVKVYNLKLEKGYHEVAVDRSDLPSAGGVFYYHLETSDAVATRKMIVINN